MLHRAALVRYIASGLCVAATAAYGFYLISRPAASSLPPASQIRSAAERIQGAAPSPALTGPAPAGSRRLTTSGDERSVKPASAPASPRSAPAPPSPAASASEPAEPGAIAADDPVKNLALMGVTSVGSSGPQAWLVNIDSGERELGRPGDEVFGFTLRAVDDDAVLLSRGDDEWEIELGERSLPGAAVTLASESLSSGDAGSRSDMRSRMMERMARMGGSSPSFDRGSRSSRYFGSRPGSFTGSGYSSRDSSYSRGRSSYRPSSSSMRSSSAARVMSSGSSRGNWSRGNSRSRNSTAQQVTSNPQAARRQGARLVGDSAPLPAPRAITNPQTERRRGSTGASGAFGQNNGQRNSRSRR